MVMLAAGAWIFDAMLTNAALVLMPKAVALSD
jgi:hypothetical protein